MDQVQVKEIVHQTELTGQVMDQVEEMDYHPEDLRVKDQVVAKEMDYHQEDLEATNQVMDQVMDQVVAEDI